MRIVRQLFDFYDRPRERTQLLALLMVVLVGSLLEIVGIGVFLPFVKIVSEPNLALENARAGAILRRLGLVEPGSIILTSSVALVSLFAFKSVYLAVQWRLVYRFGYRKMAQVSAEIFGGYLRSPLAFHFNRNSTELTQTLSTEVKLAFGEVLTPSILLSAEVIVAIGIVAVLVVVNPVAALGGLVAVGLLGWTIARLTRRRLHVLGQVRADEQQQKFRYLQQGLGGIKEIRVLRREDFFERGFRRSEKRYVRALQGSLLLNLYPRLAMELVAVFLLTGTIALLLLSGRGLEEALPTLAVFGAAVIRLVPAAGKITSGVNRIRFYTPSVVIVHDEWLRAKRADKEFQELNAGPPIIFRKEIRFEEVHYEYPDAPHPAVQSLSLSIPLGQSVGFVGPSAAGKTTLLHLLLGFLEPTSGRILVDGADIRRNIGSWQRQIGYIPQDLYLLDDSVRRNVAFGIPDDEIDEEAVWKALEAAELVASIRDLDTGLDALTGERGARLSGGQAQRLAIARALYHDPQVLILDEATSSLDYETEARISTTLQSLAGTKTLVIVSHRHQTVRHCDTIHVLENGRLASSGAFSEVFSTAI